jgi:hypothetical protein
MERLGADLQFMTREEMKVEIIKLRLEVRELKRKLGYTVPEERVDAS